MYECDCAWVSCEGSKAASGTQTSALPIRPRKPRGSTPITVYGVALMRIVRPTTAGSPPKRRVHKPWLIMAAGGVPAVCTSSQVNGRPINGATPRTDGYRSVTTSPRTRCGSPSPERSRSRPAKNAISSNTCCDAVNVRYFGYDQTDSL